MLEALGRRHGFDWDSADLRETPDRVCRAYDELLSGYRDDPELILAKRFEVGRPEMVVLKDIDFYSLCEHHLLPFSGKAQVCYLPRDSKVVGLSKLARLVECFARRLQLQERLTNDIADAIDKVLGATGVAVMIEAQHLCMSCRGVRKAGARMVTQALRGKFVIDSDVRAEVIRLLGGR